MQFVIDRIRKDKGMTQEELADKSGISRGTIVALESGIEKTTTTKTLVKLAEALSVKVDDLFLE